MATNLNTESAPTRTSWRGWTHLVRLYKIFRIVSPPLVGICTVFGAVLLSNQRLLDESLSKIGLPPMDYWRAVARPQRLPFFRKGATALVTTWPLVNPRISEIEGTRRLVENTELEKAVRFVALPANEISHIGPPKASFVFVSDFEELKNLTVKEALERVGQTPARRYSVIVIDVSRNKKELDPRPADARGFLKACERLNGEKHRQYDLSGLPAEFEEHGRMGYSMHSWLGHRGMYEAALDRVRKNSARDFEDDFSAIGVDWDPLGFSKQRERNLPRITWEVNRGEEVPFENYGARAFLVRNLPVGDLVASKTFEVGDVASTIIPDLVLTEP